MLRAEIIPFKNFRQRIRLTQHYEKAGYKIDSYHDRGYIMIFKDVEERG